MADRKALCLTPNGMAEIGPEDRLILPGDPLFDLHPASKRYVDWRFGNGLEIGEEVYRREDLTSSTVTGINQSMRLVYFTAKKSFPTTQVRVLGGTTAAAATPTLIENGLFEVDAAGDGTRVAVTGNDTSLYATASSTYTRLWLSALYSMIIGQRYALSWLTVSSFAVPTYTGMNLISVGSTEATFPARIIGTIPGQTATPTSFLAGAVNSIVSRPYGVILP